MGLPTFEVAVGNTWLELLAEHGMRVVTKSVDDVNDGKSKMETLFVVSDSESEFSAIVIENVKTLQPTLVLLPPTGGRKSKQLQQRAIDALTASGIIRLR